MNSCVRPDVVEIRPYGRNGVVGRFEKVSSVLYQEHPLKNLSSQKKKSKANECGLLSENKRRWASMSDGDGSGGGSSCASEDSDEELTYSGSDSE